MTAMLSVSTIRLLDSLILPPGGPLLVILLGLLSWRYRRLSMLLILAGLISLYLLATPYTASRLMGAVEPYPALTKTELTNTPARAILVLCGGRYSEAPEFGGDTVSPRLLARLRYAAWLQRRTGLPIAITGGSAGSSEIPESRLARQVLEDEWGARVGLIEERSRTTRENAQLSTPLLKAEQMEPVLLVTHAWHMPRAIYAFQQAGLQSIPAPTHFGHDPHLEGEIRDWLPSTLALNDSYYALHELLGRVWYGWVERRSPTSS